MAKTITDKDWLDIAWKHFQQHAQQRILYFNYFVIFSTILTTGIVTTFQNNFQVPYLGIGIGLIQSYLSIIFWKIDERNKFLTKHAENTIKAIEKDYASEGINTYGLFLGEENETKAKKETDKNKIFLWRQITHSQSYKIIFMSFFLIGLMGFGISLKKSIYTEAAKNNNQKIEININKIDSIETSIKTMNSIIKNYTTEINKMNTKIDSIVKSIDNLDSFKNNR